MSTTQSAARLAQIDHERRARRCPRAVALLDELRNLEMRCRPFSDQERRIGRHVLTVAMALRYESDLTAEQVDQIRAEVLS